MSPRNLYRLIRRAAARAIEAVWLAGFAVGARTASSEVKRGQSGHRQRILVIAPHPDDEAMGCAGTILRHVQAGDCSCVLIATDGRQSRVLPSAAEVARIRHVEAGNAARLMGIDELVWLGLPEGGWEVAQLKDQLQAVILRIRPDIIYAPSRVDFHPEHKAVAHSLALALHGASPVARHEMKIRIYQIQVPLTAALTTLAVDVTSVGSQCEAILRSYESQSGSIACAYRLRRYGARRHRIVNQAEVFWEVSSRAYVSLHIEPPATWPQAFRGLRRFPWSDPLAFVLGSGERRRLRAQSSRLV